MSIRKRLIDRGQDNPRASHGRVTLNLINLILSLNLALG